MINVSLIIIENTRVVVYCVYPHCRVNDRGECKEKINSRVDVLQLMA